METNKRCETYNEDLEIKQMINTYNVRNDKIRKQYRELRKQYRELIKETEDEVLNLKQQTALINKKIKGGATDVIK